MINFPGTRALEWSSPSRLPMPSGLSMVTYWAGLKGREAIYLPIPGSLLLYPASWGASWLLRALHRHTQESTTLPFLAVLCCWLQLSSDRNTLRWSFVNRSPCKVLGGGKLPSYPATAIQSKYLNKNHSTLSKCLLSPLASFKVFTGQEGTTPERDLWGHKKYWRWEQRQGKQGAKERV